MNHKVRVKNQGQGGLQGSSSLTPSTGIGSDIPIPSQADNYPASS